MPASYVSAEWVVNDEMGTRVIRAIGDDDTVWWIQDIDSDVIPWPAFLESELGKAFLAKGPPE